jgi:hypothetical protein
MPGLGGRLLRSRHRHLDRLEVCPGVPTCTVILSRWGLMTAGLSPQAEPELGGCGGEPGNGTQIIWFCGTESGRPGCRHQDPTSTSSKLSEQDH